MREGIYRIWRFAHYLWYGKKVLTSSTGAKKIALKVQTDHDFIVYFEAITYVLRYSHWWIPNQQFVIYKLTADCGPGAPHKLKLAAAEAVYLPRAEFFAMSERILIENVRNAYIDVIVSRVKRL